MDGNTKIVARGIIDPQEAYLFGRWEREGIRAFVDIDEKKLDEIEIFIDERSTGVNPDFSSGLASEMKVLLRGGDSGCLDQISVDAHRKLSNLLHQYMHEESFRISDAYSNALQ